MPPLVPGALFARCIERFTIGHALGQRHQSPRTRACLAISAGLRHRAGDSRTVRAPRAPRRATTTTSVNSQIVVPAVPNVASSAQAIRVPAYVDHQYVVLQDDLRGTGVVVHKRGDQIVLDLPSDVNFAFNKSDIQPRFYRVLNAVSRTQSRYPATYVDVNGHTDSIGSYSYNQVLSERRADQVADYLASRDVNDARLHVEGFGKTKPIASNATVEGRAANRRVEIILTPYAS